MIKQGVVEEEKESSNYSAVLSISRPALNIRLFIMGLFVLVSPYLIGILRGLSLRTLAIISTILILIILILLIRLTWRGLWSASATYLLIFSLFHFGALYVLGLGLSFSTYFDQYYKTWFYNVFTKEAIILSLIGFFACCMGIHLAFLSIKKPVAKVTREADLDKLLSQLFSLAGFMIMAIGILIWFIIVIRVENIFILLGSYEEYLVATAGQGILAYSNYAIALGLPLLASVANSRWHIWGYSLFVVWALIAFPLGLRGEVLFPLGAAVVVAVRNGYKLSLFRALIIFVLLLSFISVVRQIRQVGLSEIAAEEVDLNPIDALLEMGGSLRSVTETVAWEAAGEDFIYGASYWAPLERLILRFVPGIDSPNAFYDYRLLNVLIMRRVGPIGYSPIAEAFRNFGAIGVFMILLLTGVLLGRLDLWPSTTIRNSLLVVIYVPLLVQIRNSFTSVPFQWIIGLVLILAVYIATKMIYSMGQNVHSKSVPVLDGGEHSITNSPGRRNREL